MVDKSMWTEREREIDSLKREAKRLKKDTPGMTHAQALDAIAKRYRYLTWALMMKDTKPK